MEGQYNTRSPAVKRLMREAKELSEATSDYYAQPLSDNLFEWHFTVRGPSDTEFDGGVYHGRIILPPEYPMKPPNIIILTPNGRFETGKKICLSISGYHPETWQPSWSIRTALLAIIGFMPTPGQGTIGSLDYSPEERRKLAKKSTKFSCEDCCPDGAPVINLLKSREEEQKEGNLQGELSRAEEAKKLAMQVSFKGDSENSSSNRKLLPTNNDPLIEATTPNTDFQETKEEKEKRIRKEASKKMQQKFRDRLHARTSGIIGQINSKPVKQLQENTDSHPNPQATQGRTTNSTATSLQGRAHNQLPHHRQQPVLEENATERINERSYVDWFIAVIIIAIAAILYRRASTYLKFLPGSVTNTETDHTDDPGGGILPNLEEM